MLLISLPRRFLRVCWWCLVEASACDDFNTNIQTSFSEQSGDTVGASVCGGGIPRRCGWAPKVQRVQLNAIGWGQVLLSLPFDVWEDEAPQLSSYAPSKSCVHSRGFMLTFKSYVHCGAPTCCTIWRSRWDAGPIRAKLSSFTFYSNHNDISYVYWWWWASGSGARCPNVILQPFFIKLVRRRC